MPSLSLSRRTTTPCHAPSAPRGRAMKRVSPREPCCAPGLRANASAISDSAAEAKNFRPCSRHRFPSGDACVCVPETSLPPAASVIHCPEVHACAGSREVRCAKASRVASWSQHRAGCAPRRPSSPPGTTRRRWRMEEKQLGELMQPRLRAEPAFIRERHEPLLRRLPAQGAPGRREPQRVGAAAPRIEGDMRGRIPLRFARQVPKRPGATAPRRRRCRPRPSRRRAAPSSIAAARARATAQERARRAPAVAERRRACSPPRFLHEDRSKPRPRATSRREPKCARLRKRLPGSATFPSRVCEERSMSGPGGVAAEQLRAIIERIEHVEEEIKALNEGKKEIYAEAKGEGYDIKIIKEVIRIRKQDAKDRDEKVFADRPLPARARQRVRRRGQGGLNRHPTSLRDPRRLFSRKARHAGFGMGGGAQCARGSEAQKALPDIFPKPALVHAYKRALLPPTPRLAIDLYWRAHPLRADKSSRAHSPRAAARLRNGRGIWMTTRTSARLLLPIVKRNSRSAAASVACADNPPIASAGMSISGRTTSRIATPRGTPAASSRGNSGPRRANICAALRKVQGRKCPVTESAC